MDHKKVPIPFNWKRRAHVGRKWFHLYFVLTAMRLNWLHRQSAFFTFSETFSRYSIKLFCCCFFSNAGVVDMATTIGFFLHCVIVAPDRGICQLMSMCSRVQLDDGLQLQLTAEEMQGWAAWPTFRTGRLSGLTGHIWVGNTFTEEVLNGTQCKTGHLCISKSWVKWQRFKKTKQLIGDTSLHRNTRSITTIIKKNGINTTYSIGLQLVGFNTHTVELWQC